MAGTNPLFSSRIRRDGKRRRRTSSVRPPQRREEHSLTRSRSFARWLAGCHATPWRHEIHCFVRGLGGTTRGAGEHLRFARPSGERNIVSHALTQLRSLARTHARTLARHARSHGTARPEPRFPVGLAWLQKYIEIVLQTMRDHCGVSENPIKRTGPTA